MSIQKDGFVFCSVFDGNGFASAVPVETFPLPSSAAGTVWVHLDYSQDDAQQWLREKSGLSALTIEALVADETRPCAITIDNGLLVTFRGIN